MFKPGQIVYHACHFGGPVRVYFETVKSASEKQVVLNEMMDGIFKRTFQGEAILLLSDSPKAAFAGLC